MIAGGVLCSAALAALIAGCGKKASPPSSSSSFTPETCTGALRIVYQSVPNQLPPEWGDLTWAGGTLFVAHSGASDSFLFSIPDRGGDTNPLISNGLSRFWLEGDNLILVQGHSLESMPQTGGTPTLIQQFGNEPGQFEPTSIVSSFLALDGNALYWPYYTAIGVDIVRHFRGGGGDTILGMVPVELTNHILAYEAQADGQLVFAFDNLTAGAAVGTMSKVTGATALLPVPDPTMSTPLAVSAGGALLWGRGTQDANDPATGQPLLHYDLLLGNVNGATPAMFSTTLPRTVAPTAGWAAANQGWYLAGTETDSHQRPYVSIWSVAADGTAKRLACHGATDVEASAYATSLARVSAGTVADGAFYASLVFPDGTWLIGRIDNAAASPDTGDAGMAAPDGSFDAPPPLDCLAGAAPIGAGAAAHTFQEIPVPSPGSGPEAIVLGPDGNLWFSEVQTSKLAQVTPSGCITEFSLNTHYAEGLTSGPDGALWFTEPEFQQIGRMSVSGVVQEFMLPATKSESPDEIVKGPDGNLWFSDAADAVWRITTAGVATSYTPPTKARQPSSIVAGTDGMLWVVESQSGPIGRLDPSTGTITEFSVPNALSVGELGIGPDGNIWFGESQGGSAGFLAEMAPDGTVTAFPLPAGVGVEAIVTGPDGNLWFADASGNAIGQMASATHAVVEFPIPTLKSDTYHLVVGPDGNLWFTEGAGNQIGHFKL